MQDPALSTADPFVNARRVRSSNGQLPIVAAVSAGGVLGALARYGLGVLIPSRGFPWTTLGINVAGCAAMGVLMVLITEWWPSQRLLRPFLGTGVLGGFTTFSTYTLEGIRLLEHHQPVLGLAYLVATPVIALCVAVWAAASTTQRIVNRINR